MSDWYWLDEDKRPWPVMAEIASDEFRNYNEWLYDPVNKNVGNNTVDGYVISTVFLGLDHSYNGDTPVLWETMVFPSKTDFGEQYCRRYMSHADALNGHNKVVRLMSNEFTRRELIDG